MGFWNRMVFDPLSVFEGKPWWYKVLIVLPWALLLVLAASLWFLMPDKKTSEYLDKEKNKPFDTAMKGGAEQVKQLRQYRNELHKKIEATEGEMKKDDAEFADTQREIAVESHEQLKKRLYGKSDG